MIQVFHVTKTYDRGDRPALHDITLEIDKGEFVFLSGPSGAGKTTLLKLIFAAEKPTDGQILVNGRNVVKLRASQVPYLRRQIGVVFQDFKLISTHTVHENIAYALRVLGLPEAVVRQRVGAMLKGVGLSHKQHVLPLKLSGGEQQRGAIARALVNDPLVLLADEPTGNLDRDMTEEILALLQRANARGTTVIVATHDTGLMQRYGKRIIHLDAGRVMEKGPPDHWFGRRPPTEANQPPNAVSHMGATPG